MKDVVAALLMLGALVGVWFWIARKLRKKGSGGIVRHLAGSVCGFGAMFVAAIFAAAVGLIEPEPAGTNAKTAGAESAVQEAATPEAAAIEASEAEAVAAEPAEEDVSADEAAEQAEEAVEPEPKGDSIAERRDEIQAGSDIGVGVETFTANFNDAMATMELPFRARGNIDEMADGHVQRGVNETFNDHMAMVITVKPYSDDIRDLLFIGSGDGTQESGINIMMTAAGAFSATQEAWPASDALDMVISMSDEFVNQGGKVTRTLNGLEYTYEQNNVFGNMFSVSPID